MIAVDRECSCAETDWQPTFVAMLPEIEERLRRALRHLDSEARNDAVEEGVVHSLVSYCRLHKQGRANLASPSTLAWYAALRVKRGRPAVGHMNSKEPLSQYGQISNQIEIDPVASEWIDVMVVDKRALIADQVAARMDVAAWFATLSEHMKRIAKDLAFGFSTSEVACKYGLTAGRISQVRRILEESWAAFQPETSPAV